jgi:hypothetical protein
VVPAEVAIASAVRRYAILLGGPPTTPGLSTMPRSRESGACDRALVLAVEIFEECETSMPALAG